jgi:hypothetical protein
VAIQGERGGSLEDTPFRTFSAEVGSLFSEAKFAVVAHHNTTHGYTIASTCALWDIRHLQTRIYIYMRCSVSVLCVCLGELALVRRYRCHTEHRRRVRYYTFEVKLRLVRDRGGSESGNRGARFTRTSCRDKIHIHTYIYIYIYIYLYTSRYQLIQNMGSHIFNLRL